MALTTPSASASSGISIFIDSMIISTSPAESGGAGFDGDGGHMAADCGVDLGASGCSFGEDFGFGSSWRRGRRGQHALRQGGVGTGIGKVGVGQHAQRGAAGWS